MDRGRLDQSISLAKHLKNLREKRGLKRIEVARDIHVSPNSIAYWENGQVMPTRGSLKKLESEFNVNLMQDGITPRSSFLEEESDVGYSPENLDTSSSDSIFIDTNDLIAHKVNFAFNGEPLSKQESETLTAYILGFLSGVFAHKNSFDENDPVNNDQHENE